MKNTISFNKLKQHLFDSMVSEGKHWPEDYKKTAINAIKNSPLGKQQWYSEQFIIQDVNTFVEEFGPLSHKNSNLGYFATIIRWFIQYSGTDLAKYQEFIERKLDDIVRDLLWLSNSPNEESKVKEQLKSKWTYADFEKYQKDVIDKNRNVDIDIKNTQVKYKVIPINSYEQQNRLFGGDKTGYEGRSEWCHTNGRNTYDNWIDEDKNMFFILARNGWEKISPPDPIVSENAYDEYGLSLIALLVEKNTGKLLNATLRWNHIIDPSRTVQGTSADHAFSTWEQINKIAGINVEDIVKKTLKEYIEKFQYDMAHANENLTEIMNRIAKKDPSGMLSIRALEEEGFSRGFRDRITKIIIPEGIKHVDNDTFYSFKNVKEIKLPSTLITIGDYAFSYMIDVLRIDLPENLKYIGKSAFACDESIRVLNFNKNLEKIEESAFRNCKDLTEIELPDSLKEIGQAAFVRCEYLKHVKLGNGLVKIGNDAFSGCEYLESINFPESLTTISEYAFDKCKKLKEIKLPKNLTTLSGYAFEECESLTHIEIPENLKIIGKYAFKGCKNLTSVSLPNNVEIIGSFAFSSCSSLKTIDLSTTKVKKFGMGILSDNENLETVILPKDIQSIDGMTFYNCEKLKSIDIPPTVESIGDSAFYCCYALKEINFPENLEQIGPFAFEHCNGLTSVIVPNSVTSIGTNAFMHCENLKSVKFGEQLYEIDSCAFAGCVKLENVDFKDSFKLRYIYESAFNGCDALKAVKLPIGVEHIGSFAFKDCINLQELVLPYDLMSIGNGIIDNCPRTIKVKGTKKALEIYRSQPQRNESIKMSFDNLRKMLFE